MKSSAKSGIVMRSRAARASSSATSTAPSGALDALDARDARDAQTACDLPLSCNPDELSNAIDVVARLTRRAGRMAGDSASANAMSAVLGASFKYMVAFSQHRFLDNDEPDEALVKAAG